MARQAPRHPVFPVVGELCPDHRATLLAAALDTRHVFAGFDTGELYGLAYVEGSALHLLVLEAVRPGQGHGARFLAECKAAYDAVYVYELMNPRFEAMLARIGFRPFERRDEDGYSTGMGWTRTPFAP